DPPDAVGRPAPLRPLRGAGPAAGHLRRRRRIPLRHARAAEGHPGTAAGEPVPQDLADEGVPPRSDLPHPARLEAVPRRADRPHRTRRARRASLGAPAVRALALAATADRGVHHLPAGVRLRGRRGGGAVPAGRQYRTGQLQRAVRRTVHCGLEELPALPHRYRRRADHLPDRGRPRLSTVDGAADRPGGPAVAATGPADRRQAGRTADPGRKGASAVSTSACTTAGAPAADTTTTFGSREAADRYPSRTRASSPADRS